QEPRRSYRGRELKGGVSGRGYLGRLLEGSVRKTLWARQGFRSRDQLCFSGRFVCLFARSGLRVSNAARNDLVAVVDDFPIPVPFGVAGHNAEFNAVCHVALGGARLRPEMILMRIK